MWFLFRDELVLVDTVLQEARDVQVAVGIHIDVTWSHNLLAIEGHVTLESAFRVVNLQQKIAIFFFETCLVMAMSI